MFLKVFVKTLKQLWEAAIFIFFYIYGHAILKYKKYREIKTTTTKRQKDGEENGRKTYKKRWKIFNKTKQYTTFYIKINFQLLFHICEDPLLI